MVNSKITARFKIKLILELKINKYLRILECTEHIFHLRMINKLIKLKPELFFIFLIFA